jgi:FkbM family methyltransferase
MREPPSNAVYDAQTVSVIERCLLPHSSCVDVGCHQGSVLEHVLRLAPRGRHFAFEPLPAYATLLRERFAQARVAVFELALSDTAGEATFQHVVTNPSYSGLRRRRYDRDDERLEEIRVRTERLDALLPPELPIALIKIDVEGAELQVLRGATETLRRWKPVVVFEHGLGAADHYGTTPEAVHELLAGCGLRVSTMERWLAGEGALDRETFAAHFRNGWDYYFIAHS